MMTIRKVEKSFGLHTQKYLSLILYHTPLVYLHVRTCTCILCMCIVFISVHCVYCSCTECTQSDFPCTWCVGAHKCTHDRESCGNDVLVTGQNVSIRRSLRHRAVYGSVMLQLLLLMINFYVKLSRFCKV